MEWMKQRTLPECRMVNNENNIQPKTMGVSSLLERLSRLLKLTAMFALLFTAYTAEAHACGGACLTSTNAEHAQNGRAEYRDGDEGQGYYATGSGTFMGRDGNSATSLVPSDDYYDYVVGYYADYGYSPVEIFQCGCGSSCFGVVFQQSCGCGCYCVVYMTIEGWEPRQCDSDCDGMDDAWEYENIGNMWSDGQGDKDGDGASDYIEFITGTDPNDDSSLPPAGNFYRYDARGRVKNILRME